MSGKAHQPGAWSMTERRSGGLVAALRTVSMPQFLGIALPLTLVFVAGFLLEYRGRMGAEEARLFARERSIIERAAGEMRSELEITISDLAFAAELATTVLQNRMEDGTQDGGRSPPSLLAAGFRALAESRPGYSRIRYLDPAGQELLGIERTTDGVRLLSPAELAHEGDRDDFRQAMRLAPGQVLVSRMALAFEGGVVRQPPLPVLRLATPLVDDAGSRRGVIAIDARGERFLGALPRSVENAGVQHMIVDAYGYWLRHRPELEWGFALAHGMGFRRAFPEIWEQMAELRQGRLESVDGLFYFDAVPSGGRAESSAAAALGEPHWMLVSFVPRVVLDDITARVGTRLLVTAIPLYFALLGVCWLLAAGLERRRAADQALRDLEFVRSSMLRAALDAIIVMDESGVTLEFNPAAQQIFGYTLEEARGRLVADLIIPAAHREAHRLGLERYLATGEGRIVDQHIGELTGIRKDGSEIPVELTICPITVSGRHLFCGFIRDLSEPEPKPGEDGAEALPD